ncbi:MAG: hypothetical protein KDD61_07790 [Bdellovibrionales bacterium]|nr:hypothetical protein [Bdellovibrionales bacterium]
MKISKEALFLAKDLNLNEADAAIIQLKANLYQKAANCIQKSKFSHGTIAKMAGTSRVCISRVFNLGENSLCMELLIKIIVALKNKIPLKVVKIK